MLQNKVIWKQLFLWMKYFISDIYDSNMPKHKEYTTDGLLEYRIWNLGRDPVKKAGIWLQLYPTPLIGKVSHLIEEMFCYFI